MKQTVVYLAQQHRETMRIDQHKQVTGKTIFDAITAAVPLCPMVIASKAYTDCESNGKAFFEFMGMRYIVTDWLNYYVVKISPKTINE